MRKTKVNITLDKDLVEFAKGYAAEQRTTVSEIVGQFILNLKRTKEREPTEIILSDPDFTNGERSFGYPVRNPVGQDEMARL